MGKNINEIIDTDKNFKALLKNLVNDKSKTKDEGYKEVLAYLASKNINAGEEDIDELLKNSKLSVFKNELSETELSSISGGLPTGLDGPEPCPNSEWYCHYSAGYAFYPEPGCSATVEFESWCGSDDCCYIWDVEYKWQRK